MEITSREIETLSSLPYGFKLLRRCFAYQQMDAFLW